MPATLKPKLCKTCGVTKPTTEFHKHARMKDGLASDCKVCRCVAVAQWQAANPEKVKARSTAWYAANREKVKAATAKYRAANPDKAKEYITKWKAANPEKVKAAAAKRYAANTDKHNAASAKWHAANPEKAKAKGAKWAALNKNKIAAKNAKWGKENPEARRIINHNRRARKLEAGGTLSKGLSEKLYAIQRGKCACGCGQSLGTDFHRDHIMPLALGGANVDLNMQLLTATCNLQKSARHPIDFMQSRGFLL